MSQRETIHGVNGRSTTTVNETGYARSKTNRRKDRRRHTTLRMNYSLQPATTQSTPDAQKKSDVPGNHGGVPEWGVLDGKFKILDEKMIKNWNDEIDTLLVFAGLFSAVLTAFNIEFYRKLNSDPSDTSLRVLLQISQQLASFTISNGFLNSSAPLFPSLPLSFTPERSTVQINILWFSSLVFSLVTASLGMLVKQWLREYLAGDHSSPRIHARLRQFRYHGLSRWRVFEIMAILPTLLQISLILFLIGLIQFLTQIHEEVANVVACIVGIWLTVYAVTTFLPTLSPQCPYKSPQARVLYNIVRVIKGEKPWKVQSPSPHLSWERFETEALLDEKLESDALVTADATFSDDEALRDIIKPCLADFDEGSSLIQCLRRIVIHRLQGHVLPSFVDAIGANLGRMTQKAAVTIFEIVLDALNRISAQPGDDKWIMDALSIVNKTITRKAETTSVDKDQVDSSDSYREGIDSAISKVVTKLLASKSHRVIREALHSSSLLILRYPNCVFKMPENTPSDALDFMLGCCHDIFYESVNISKGKVTTNPLALYCVLLSLLQDRNLNEHKTRLEDLITQAARAINVTHAMQFPTLAQHCRSATGNLQKQYPGVGNNIIEKISS